MMNHTHSLTGAAAALAVAPALTGPIAELHPANLGQLALFAAAAAGAATLPDLDHPDSSPSHFLSPVTVVLAVIVSTLTGGHRKAAHWPVTSIVVAAAAAAMVWLAPPAATAVTAGLVAALGMWASGTAADRVTGITAAAVVTALTVAWDRQHPTGPWWWLPVAVGIGYLAHVIGDMVFGGVAVGPSGDHVHIAELKTGGAVETAVVRPAALFGVVAGAAWAWWGPAAFWQGSVTVVHVMSAAFA